MAYMNMFRGTLRNGSGRVGLHLLLSGMRREEEDGVRSSSDDSPRQTFVNFRTCEGPWAPRCLLNTWKHPLLASSTTFIASKWRPIKHGSVSSGTLAVSKRSPVNPGAATWNLLNYLKLQVKFITFPLNIGFICGKCELYLLDPAIDEEQNWRAQRLVEIEILLVISFESPGSSAMTDFFLLNPTESRTDSHEKSPENFSAFPEAHQGRSTKLARRETRKTRRRFFFPESVWAQGSSNSGGLYLIFSSSHLLIFTSAHLV